MLRGASCVLLALCACGDDADPGTAVRVHALATCPDAAEAPIPDGSGGIECRRVGADPASVSGEFADATGLPMPVVFVRAGASGGDGTGASPFGTLAEALAATPTPATVLLARGEHVLEDAVTLPATDVTLAGAGPTVTTLVTPDGDGLVAGAGAATLRDLGLRAPTTASSRALAAASAGGITLEDVHVQGGHDAISVTATTLTARGLTVEGAANVGLFLGGGAQAEVTSLLVRDGARYGVVTDASRISMEDALVTHHGRDGIALLGLTGGDPHQLVGVVSSDNGVTALRVERGVLHGALLLLQGTRVPEGTTGGDGLYVGDAGRVILDMAIAVDADRAHGSQILANARTGVLAAGAGTDLEVRGALVGSNEGPGVFLQDSASSALIGFSSLVDNGALGIGVASGAAIVEIPCDLIAGTRTATLRTTTAELELGDGISIAESPAGSSTFIHGNVFENNARYACVMTQSDATLRDNTGSGNGFPPAWWNGTVDADATNTVDARRMAPEAPPLTATGQIALGGGIATR